MVRPPTWMRWLGPPLLLGTWVLFLSPVVLAVRERDWMAHVRDSGLGVGGALVGWFILAVLLVVIPPAIKVLLTYRTVLDAGGVDPPLGRARVDLGEVRKIRWVPQGGPVNAANRPERFEVISEQSGLVARVARGEADWGATQAVLRHWARQRPEIVEDEPTAAALAGGSIDS
ncbi:hypothetical protein N798_17130 [Knoellia flava TL1]|uniref:PH domain-containing protein n=1 Tax=Knoellia flava TL1 TaxID=1385518 RepID=A0ABR4XA65_9MICO|nr:hypothetical protein N798_17130 [Knoellia flava TL1]